MWQDLCRRLKKTQSRILVKLRTPEEFEKEEKKKDGHVCKITLFKNGFIVDDGEFCDYSLPENKEFMQELNKGNIPKQLRKKYPKGGLSVSLSDKTEETYTPPPPPPYTAFSGSGVSFEDPGVKKPTTFGKKKGFQENFFLEPDRSRDITTMQVRLADGQRIPLEANLDTRLQDVFNHIATVSGVSNF